MSAQELITEHLDLWTGAVTKKSSSGRGSNGKVELTGVKKLRELILELAVRGKLVDQNLKDESSGELLKKIVAEKNKRIERGEIKKPKELSAIDDTERPFQIPASWKFIRLGNAVDIIRGITFPASEKSKSPMPGRLACLRTTNVQDTIEVHDLLYIKESFVTKSSQYIQKNDIVMSMANSRELVGKVAFVEEQPDEPMTFGGFLGVLRPTLIHPKFLMAVLRAPNSRATLIGNASQTTNIANISIGKLNPLVIGLPPLEEQHRIVQKVDELMALCDRLEQQTSDQLEAHETLVDTLLGTLTQSENATELADNWARLAAHFDTLFTTEQSIDKLKQTILQLAVMGRLVKQDEADEPVDLLLSQIEAHQQKRYQSKEIQKPKKIKAPESLDIELPLSWRTTLLNDLAFVTKLAGFEYTKHLNLRADGEVPVIRAQNVRPFKPDISNLKYIDLDTSLQLPRSAIDRTCLLITFIGAGIGDVCTMSVDKRWHLAPNVAKVELFGDTSPRFINIFLCSPSGQKELFKSLKSTAQPSLSMTTIREIWIPIPPLAEQHRIVQKVDELMALCDQLRERLNNAGETRCQLAGTVVEKALG